MTERLMVLPRPVDSLHSIVPLTPLLELDGEKVRPKDPDVMIEVPTNEFGIPQPREFLAKMMGSLATDHYWQGEYDVHHMAWPGSAYRSIKGRDDELLGAKYRGSAALKVRVRRQKHNLFHHLSLPPTPPSEEVMRQWVFEQEQVYRLYDSIKLGSMSAIDVSQDIKEQLRHESYLRKLETMQDGELGLMPDKEMLSVLTIDEARRTLRALARVQGISNAKPCKRAFFGNMAA